MKTLITIFFLLFSLSSIFYISFKVVQLESLGEPAKRIVKILAIIQIGFLVVASLALYQLYMIGLNSIIILIDQIK